MLMFLFKNHPLQGFICLIEAVVVLPQHCSMGADSFSGRELRSRFLGIAAISQLPGANSDEFVFQPLFKRKILPRKRKKTTFEKVVFFVREGKLY
jgi:hypothetical protein